MKLLWKRFQQLGADKSGQLDRAVFSDSDIYSDIFCTQVNISRGWHSRILCILIFVRSQNLDRKFFIAALHQSDDCGHFH